MAARPNDRTKRMRELADYIEGIDDVPTNPNIHVHVGDTGRFPAAEAVTRPQPTKSESPKSELGWVLRFVRGINNPWSAIVALGLCALIGWYLYLRSLGQ